MKAIFSGVIVILGLLPTLSAADPSFECSMKASSQLETANCLQAVEETVEMTLEATLKLAAASARDLDGITGRALAVPALERSQKSWAQYREEQCNFVGTMFGGGSGTGIAIRSCRIELGRARVKQLFDEIR
jgi:uncharacterized protein YecT (DUF1311 family)